MIQVDRHVVRITGQDIPPDWKLRGICTGSHVVAVEGDGLPFTGINLDEGHSLSEGDIRLSRAIHGIRGRLDATHGHSLKVNRLAISVERELGDATSASRKRHEGDVAGRDGLTEEGERAIRRDLESPHQAHNHRRR